MRERDETSSLTVPLHIDYHERSGLRCERVIVWPIVWPRLNLVVARHHLRDLGELLIGNLGLHKCVDI